jgi:hypothetical protein
LGHLFVCALVLGFTGASWSAFAQDTADGQSLSQAASDPTASLMSFQFQGSYNPNYHNAPGADGSSLQFRAAIPFALGSTSNIARLTLPYITDTPGGANGLADATLFNLTVFDQPWGRYGLGAVALMPTGTNGISSEKWGLGPAFGFTARTDKLIWGAFNQNIFTVAGDDARPDVDVSIIQPIFNYSLGDGWSVGTSEMTFTYDWNRNEFVSLPLGFKVSKLTTIGRQKVQFTGSYERNFYDEGVAVEDTIQFIVKLLVPK